MSKEQGAAAEPEPAAVPKTGGTPGLPPGGGMSPAWLRVTCPGVSSGRQSWALWRGSRQGQGRSSARPPDTELLEEPHSRAPASVERSHSQGGTRRGAARVTREEQRAENTSVHGVRPHRAHSVSDCLQCQELLNSTK